MEKKYTRAEVASLMEAKEKKYIANGWKVVPKTGASVTISPKLCKELKNYKEKME